MTEQEARPRVSRGEEALYGELAILVRQVGLAYVALADARDVCVDWLSKAHEESHPPADEKLEQFLGTAPEGTVRFMWEKAFSIIGVVEPVLEQAFFELGDHALSTRRRCREGIDSLPVFSS